jgi:hypothetical protein
VELAGRWIAAVIFLQIVSKHSVLDFKKHHSLVSFWKVSVHEAVIFTQETDIHLVDSGMVSHPYSIYIWQPPHSPKDVEHWNEPVQCYTEQWAVYVAGLMHKDSHSVIKVVRFGLNIACFPNEHAVELVERQIARQRVQQ